MTLLLRVKWNCPICHAIMQLLCKMTSKVHQKNEHKAMDLQESGKIRTTSIAMVLLRFSGTLLVKVSSELSKETFLEHSHSISAIINGGKEETIQKENDIN